MKKILIVIVLFVAMSIFADFPRPWEIIFYTNSTVAYCDVTIDGNLAETDDEVGVFFEAECRGVGYVVVIGEQSVCTMNIQGNVIEEVEFAVWDASEDLVCEVAYTTNTMPGGDIGYPPDLLPIAAVSDPNQNLSPVWSLPDSISWDEDNEIELDLSDYAFDPEGETLQFNCLDQGEISVNIINGMAILQPGADYFGVSELVFSASDGENTALDSIMANVLSVNDPPQVIIGDEFSFEEDGELIIDLSDYVSDVDGDELNIIISNNHHLDWEVDGLELTLTGEENWNGEENLVLTAFDGAAFDSDNFMVTITPVNDPPEWNLPADISFEEDASITINLNNYCFDPDGDELSYSYSEVENLDIAINAGVMEISAVNDWHGTEEIILTALDPDSLSSDDVLPVVVTPVNDAPEINLPESMEFAEDGMLEVDFTDFVSDVDGDELSLSVSGNSHINVEITGLNVMFSAAVNWWGVEVLTFTVSDGQERLSASDQVILDVTSVNDPPVINLPEVFSFYTYSELVEDFGSYIDDIDSDELELSAEAGNNVSVDIDEMIVTFSVEPGWFGTEEISFTVSDQENEVTDTAMVEVLELGELPDLILPERITFAEDTQSVRDFANYIFNSEGFELSLSVEGNQNITVGIEGFEVLFSSPADWWGEELMEFTISDQEAGFSTSDSVWVEVTAVNDAPEIDLPDEINFAEDTIYQLDCEPYIMDIDSEILSLSVTGNQEILVNISELNLEFLPEPDYNGQELVTVTVSDNEGRAIASDDLTVDVTAVNDVPVMNLPAEIIFAEDNIYELSIMDYINDVDGDSLEINLESDFGCEFDWEDNAVNLSPPENYYGNGTLTVVASDRIETVTGMIAVTVQPVNDAPILELPDSFSFEEDTVFSFDIMDYAFDADEDNLLITYTGIFYIFVEINGTEIQLESLSNWNGNANMTFTVDDGQATATDEIEIIVEPVNDPPVINSFEPQQTELLYYGETALEFSVNVYDGDSEIDFDWYINDISQEVNSPEFDYLFTDNGEYTVRVEVSDEEYMVSQEWQITIYGGPGWELTVYTNSTVTYSVVTIDDEPAGENDLVGAFVDGECRGIGDIVLLDGVSYSSFLIQGETVETVNFKIYSAEAEEIYDVLYTAQTNPGGDLGYPPDDLIVLAAYSQPGPGWSVTDQYENYTTAYTRLLIDGLAASALDSLGAFDTMGECLGVSGIEIAGDQAFAEIEVYQDDIVDFSFRIWDADNNAIYEDFELYQTVPGGSIGAPGSEIEVEFSSVPGPNWSPVIYTNSTTGYFILDVNNEPAAENDLLGVFVEAECRGVGYITYFEEEAHATVEIQGEEIEECYLKLWDASIMEILELDQTILTNPGGEIGYPPDEIELNFWTFELPEFQVFPRPWEEVYYTNSTVAYGSMTIDNEPGTEGDEVAAFIGGECRGIGTLVLVDEESIFTMNIQGDSPEIVQFNYYDVSEDMIYSVEFVTVTNPGGDIGYPPDLLSLEIYTNFPPVVDLPSELSFNEDEVAELDLSDYITDPDDDELSFSVSGNVNITIEIDGMLVTAQGDENWHGTETISYSVDDGHDHIVTGEINLVVLPVNDPPLVTLPYSFTIQEDQLLEVDFEMFITDIEGDAWTLAVDGEENVTISISGSMVQFEPDANWCGQETVTFYADDGMDIGSDELLIIINPQPDAPIVEFPEQLTIQENDQLVLAISDYISDPDGDEVDIYLTGNDHIALEVSEDSLTFIPEMDWFGTENVTINADDGRMRLIGSDEVYIVVEHVPQAPDLNLPEQFVLMEDIPQSFDLTPYFTIYEGEEFEFSAVGNDSVTITFDQAEMAVSAPENWNGTESVVITLEDDPTRTSVSDTVDITFEEVNDAPELVSWQPEEFEFEVTIDTTITFSVDYFDVENNMGYSWFIDGIEQPEIDSVLTVIFDTEGEFEIRSMAFDEEYENYITWNVVAIEVDSDIDAIYKSTELLGNYPNPFNPQTIISFNVLNQDLPAKLAIYNLKGQMIKTWNIVSEGQQKVIWQGNDEKGVNQASGIYFSRLSHKHGVSCRRLMLLK